MKPSEEILEALYARRKRKTLENFRRYGHDDMLARGSTLNAFIEVILDYLDANYKEKE